MSAPEFLFRIVTPLRVLQRQIYRIRLKDRTGYFGIMKGHSDFLTVLEPSLGYYRDASGKEVFLAVDGGVFSVRDGVASLISRDVHESDDPEMLAELIEGTVSRRDESETALRQMLEGIEKAFLEKSISLARGRS